MNSFHIIVNNKTDFSCDDLTAKIIEISGDNLKITKADNTIVYYPIANYEIFILGVINS